MRRGGQDTEESLRLSLMRARCPDEALQEFCPVALAALCVLGRISSDCAQLHAICSPVRWPVEKTNLCSQLLLQGSASPAVRVNSLPTQVASAVPLPERVWLVCPEREDLEATERGKMVGARYGTVNGNPRCNRTVHRRERPSIPVLYRPRLDSPGVSGKTLTTVARNLHQS